LSNDQEHPMSLFDGESDDLLERVLQLGEEEQVQFAREMAAALDEATAAVHAFLEALMLEYGYDETEAMQALEQDYPELAALFQTGGPRYISPGRAALRGAALRRRNERYYRSKKEG
jgi:signal transduction histidine kinase